MGNITCVRLVIARYWSSTCARASFLLLLPDLSLSLSLTSSLLTLALFLLLYENGKNVLKEKERRRRRDAFVDRHPPDISLKPLEIPEDNPK